MANGEVKLVVKNCFNHAVLSKVSLTYQPKTVEPKCETWEMLELKPGEITSALSLGSFPSEGKDIWELCWDVAVEVSVTDTTIATLSNKTKQLSAPLHSSDAGKDVVIEISESEVRIVKASGDKKDKVKIEVNSNPTRPDPVPYSYMAYVTLQNKFPVAVSVDFSHQYSDKTLIKKSMHALATDSVSEPWPVFYNSTMFGSDFWTAHVTMNMPDSYPSPVWKNPAALKAALVPDDAGKVVECSLDGKNGFKMQFPTFKTEAALSSPLGYSKTAFGAMKNNFKVPIKKVLLKHSYGKHKACYVRYGVSPGATSDPFAIEYYTGKMSPFHFWNIVVELEDGSRYVNCDKDQKLYFKSADANIMHIFGVSDSTFLIRLVSEHEAFETDVMLSTIILPNQGRDLTLPYDRNAFLLSHSSYASLSNGFGAQLATQSYNLHAQIAEGATALELDLYDFNDDVAVHNVAPQQQLLANELCHVKNYMKNNLCEVVTIFLRDNVIQHRDQIESAFRTANLWDQVFFCDGETAGWTVSTQGWPKLQWMIENKKRLVVFTTSKDGPFPHLWTHASENVSGTDSVEVKKWTYKRYESAELNSCPLMLLNHFPTPPGAGKKNDSALIQKHIIDTRKHWTHLPNFLSLEFFEQPEGASNLAIIALNKKIQQHI